MPASSPASLPSLLSECTHTPTRSRLGRSAMVRIAYFPTPPVAQTTTLYFGFTTLASFPVGTLNRFEGFGDIAVQRLRGQVLAHPLLEREIPCCKGELDKQAGTDVDVGVRAHAFGDQLYRPLFVGRC